VSVPPNTCAKLPSETTKGARSTRAPLQRLARFPKLDTAPLGTSFRTRSQTQPPIVVDFLLFLPGDQCAFHSGSCVT